MEFHTRRYHINLQRINALTDCSRPLDVFLRSVGRSFNTVASWVNAAANYAVVAKHGYISSHLSRSTDRDDVHGRTNHLGVIGADIKSREERARRQVRAKISTTRYRYRWNREVEYRSRGAR